jgi:type VI secretion system protein ImpH
MAAESGRADPSVAALLFEEGYRFDFFQAVRVLERLYPHRAAVGGSARPGDEIARFQSHPSLAFPPSAIHDVKEGDEPGRPVIMTVAFMGLTGPLGVLPRHYTELILERAKQKDATFRDFLTLFDHRLISLFYRAWEKYRAAIAYEHARTHGEGLDTVSPYLFDLFGMGTEGLRRRFSALADESLLYYAGLLGQRPHSATALQGLLEDYFAVPVQISQLRGQWLTLSEDNRSRLGGAESGSSQIGSAILGKRVWDQQATFRLRVGPLDIAQFHDFLPSGTAFAPLAELTRFFVGQELDFDVQLVLRAADVPGCRLGDTGPRGPRLGWSTWLRTAAFPDDADDTILAGRLTRLGAIPG